MVDGLETAAHSERAAVVAWLRAEVDAAMKMKMPARAATFLTCAEAIERGEHRAPKPPENDPPKTPSGA